MHNSLDHAVAGKLPLAQSVLLLLRYAFDHSGLNAVFRSHRGRNYQDTITFPLCCERMAETLPWPSPEDPPTEPFRRPSTAVICFLLYNATLIVRDIVAEQAQQSSQDVSLQLLFEDLVGELIG